MTNTASSASASSAPLPDGPTLPGSGGVADRWFALRRELPAWQAVLTGLAGILACFALWWTVTRGDPEERIISPSKGLSSPAETFASFPSLWFDRALTRNLLTTLRRLALGFGLAALVGVPLGVLCGCFPRVQAFFLPMTLFGRNIPVAALIPLTFSLFGIGELQKVVFIFMACVAFVVWDTARAVQEVGSEYIDTAYTLGAGTWQTIGKVLLPLALPSVFNSLRLIFGLAFGYIMLAEVVKFGGETGGLGDLINISQRRGPREHVLLILLIIPVVALGIDRLFFTVQAELFPYRYGGTGTLNRLVRAVLHAWEDLRLWMWKALKGLFGQRTPANPTDDRQIP
jgi:NitT/TauT family transport system permease protein